MSMHIIANAVSLHGIIFQAIVALIGPREVSFDTLERYAVAVERAVDSEQLPFSGRQARERSALLLLALAYQESSLLEEIEQCRFRQRAGMDEDRGRSVGLTQLYEGWSWRGHSRGEICGDAELQFSLALRYVSEQARRCGDVERALTGYNRNQCVASIYAAVVMRRYRRLAEKLGFSS